MLELFTFWFEYDGTHIPRHLADMLKAHGITTMMTTLTQGDECPDQHYVLRLFVAGTTPNSLRAVQNIRLICEEHLQGRHKLEVIDIYQHAGQLAAEQVVVAPTLVKKGPLPVRRLIGNLANRTRVLAGLDIVPRPAPE